jgi:hypothetical protein
MKQALFWDNFIKQKAADSAGSGICVEGIMAVALGYS